MHDLLCQRVPQPVTQLQVKWIVFAETPRRSCVIQNVNDLVMIHGWTNGCEYNLFSKRCILGEASAVRCCVVSDSTLPGPDKSPYRAKEFQVNSHETVISGICLASKRHHSRPFLPHRKTLAIQY